MDEFQIARSTAGVLHRMSHPGEAEVDNDAEGDLVSERVRGRKRKEWLSVEEQQLVELKCNAYELAMSRARKRMRDIGSVLVEVELEIGFQLAKILAGTIDPVLEGLEETGIQDGDVCRVCQEDMDAAVGDLARAMACKHKFHAYCIVKWLKGKKQTCPICRYQMQLGKQELKI